MPLDTIYLTRHGHRLNWTIDPKTGTYTSQFPTPTGNPSDPTLTSHGVRQSHELAAHILSENVHPKPFRIYSSPFFRCLQTIRPTVERLKAEQSRKAGGDGDGDSVNVHIDPHAQFEIRVENGLGEWFGSTTFFHHPTPPTLSTYIPKSRSNQPENPHITSLRPYLSKTYYPPILHPSTRGETIAQLHARVAKTLSALIASLDAEIALLESDLPPEKRTSKAIMICAHAAPLIAMGRVLTGDMPGDVNVEDFSVYTAGLSTFRRRRREDSRGSLGGVDGDGDGNGNGKGGGQLAPGTKLLRDGEGLEVPDWMGGRGVGGGWDCVVNGDCSFLSCGAERGWHFNGEESFDTGPMASESETPTTPLGADLGSGSERLGTKL